MQETWKPVPGFEHYYECSNLGVVRTCSEHNKKSGWRTLKARPTPRGYFVVCLFRDRKRHWMTVHRIIWRTFCWEIPDGFTINHKNGVKADNRFENLECISLSENVKHAFRILNRKPSVNGLFGSRQPSSKLTESDVVSIRARFSGRNRAQLAREYGVSASAIGRIISRDTWDHVD